MSYADLLRDPQWQRKRLEVMQAAGFACAECGDTTTTLNVHHTYYAKGRKPWEYELDELRCLCEPCHELITVLLATAHRALGGMPLTELNQFVGTIVRRLPVQAPARLRRPLGLPVGMSPEHAAVVTRMEEIDRLLPAATSDEKDALTREKMTLTERLRTEFGGRQWKAFR
jgi:hypothetical protein